MFAFCPWIIYSRNASFAYCVELRTLWFRHDNNLFLCNLGAAWCNDYFQVCVSSVGILRCATLTFRGHALFLIDTWNQNQKSATRLDLPRTRGWFSPPSSASPPYAFTHVKAEDLVLINNSCYEISGLRKSKSREWRSVYHQQPPSLTSKGLQWLWASLEIALRFKERQNKIWPPWKILMCCVINCFV